MIQGIFWGTTLASYAPTSRFRERPHMRLLACLLFSLWLIGCGSGSPPPAESAPAAPTTSTPASGGVADRVPADHVLQPQLQTLDKARGVQDLADQARERIDAAADEQQP